MESILRNFSALLKICLAIMVVSNLMSTKVLIADTAQDELCNKALDSDNNLSMDIQHWMWSVAILLKGGSCHQGEVKLSADITEQKFCTLLNAVNKSVSQGKATKTTQDKWESFRESKSFDCNRFAEGKDDTGMTTEVNNFQSNQEEKERSTENLSLTAETIDQRKSDITGELDLVGEDSPDKQYIAITDADDPTELAAVHSLDCTVTDTSQLFPYKVSDLDWTGLADRFHLSLYQDYAKFAEHGEDNESKYYESKSIIHYVERVKAEWENVDIDTPTLKLDYFKENGRFTYTVFFAGARMYPLGPVWGDCIAVDNDFFAQNKSVIKSTVTADEPTALNALQPGNTIVENNDLTQLLSKAKVACEDIGFTPKTEAFGNCVLRLLDK